RRDHTPRREGAAGSGRLESLHHLVGRGFGRQSDRVRRASGEWREGLVRLAYRRRAREAARQVGFGEQPRGAEGGRARDAEARLGLRAPRLARAMGLARRLPQEPARRAGDPGDHSILEYREDLTRLSSRKPPKAAIRDPFITRSESGI